MSKFQNLPFHPEQEKLVKLLQETTQNDDPLFFRIIVGYYYAVAASMMRCSIQETANDKVLINMYAIALAVSGAGKTKAVTMMENKVFDQFRTVFQYSTQPTASEIALAQQADKTSAISGQDPDEIMTSLKATYDSLGPIPFSFLKGTEAGLQELRYKIQMGNIGALNLQSDEIGLNLSSLTEALIPYLELFDAGLIKQKITKNTNENKRREELRSATPANYLGFGEPSKIFNGGTTEELFWSLEQNGYVRRAFHAYNRIHNRLKAKTALEIYNEKTCQNTSNFLSAVSTYFGRLADISNANKTLAYPKDAHLLMLEYQIDCKERSEQLLGHEHLKKTELEHRHFKTLKLAGAYAFVDGSPEVTVDHIQYAIAVAEESGKAYADMLRRDMPYVKLAKYIGTVNKAVTHADLTAELPYYKGPKAVKEEMLTLAIAHGYKNSIVITKDYKDGIEFLEGSTLEETTLNDMIVSHSFDMAKGYAKETPKWSQLWEMTQHPKAHWCNHAMTGGNRNEDSAIPGFNMVVLDIDKGVPISTALDLLKDYRSLLYTTKSHTDAVHSYRIILPTNFTLELSADDYKEFMRNFLAWLPFKVDEATSQRARKWRSHKGQYSYQKGKLLDVLPFIPKTTKNEQFKSRITDQAGMDNMERWFINNIQDGSRNNMLHRFAMTLVDAGLSEEMISQKVLTMNSKLPSPLDMSEVQSTVLTTVKSEISKR